MRKRYKIWLTVIVILIILTSLLGVMKLFMPKDEEKNPNVTNVIDSIQDYGYSLDDRDSKYMQEEFKNLIDILKSSEVDDDAYATSLAKLFIIDFYTLNNKINKYDVGSLEYILSDKVDEFKAKAMDTIYFDLIDNTYKDRVQELPEITEVNIENLEHTKFDLNEENMDAIKVTLKFSYKKDLGYDKEGTIYFVKKGNKLEVVKYIPTIEE